jgi:hypothetical protein
LRTGYSTLSSTASTRSLFSHPRPSRARTRRYAIPLAGLAAATTAASLTLIEVGGTTPATSVKSSTPAYALATWTARPTPADPAQITAAEANCSPASDQAGAARPAPGEKQGPLQFGGPWSPVLVDTRGDLTLTLYSDGNDTVACLASPSVISLNPIDSSGERPVTDNTASLDKVIIRKLAAGDVYTVGVGRTGSSVTAVGLQLQDGSEVTATVGNGRFIAWWPEGHGVKGLSITTKTGTADYPVDQSFARPGPQAANKTVRLSPDHPNNKSS